MIVTTIIIYLNSIKGLVFTAVTGSSVRYENSLYKYVIQLEVNPHMVHRDLQCCIALCL